MANPDGSQYATVLLGFVERPGLRGEQRVGTATTELRAALTGRGTDKTEPSLQVRADDGEFRVRWPRTARKGEYPPQIRAVPDRLAPHGSPVRRLLYFDLRG